ncbi:MAG: GNAT family N-acetyltransferase [Rubrivivax sp.]
MTLLRAMRADQFDIFIALASQNYARDNVASGRWPEADALALARSETSTLLKGGINTEGHLLFQIVPPDLGATVGYLWLSTLKRGSRSVAYVYQVLVLHEFRRQGFARAALLEAEALSRQAGHQSIALTVFASNASARALYASLGYRPMNMTLTKDLQ